MKLTREARRTSKKLFQAVLRNGRVDADAARSVITALGKSRPRHYLQILKDFKRQIRLELAKSECYVESASELDPSERAQITAGLRQRHGADLNPQFRVVPSLLGGLRIRIGSNLWDGSIRGRLDRLASKL